MDAPKQAPKQAPKVTKQSKKEQKKKDKPPREPYVQVPWAERESKSICKVLQSAIDDEEPLFAFTRQIQKPKNGNTTDELIQIATLATIEHPNTAVLIYTCVEEKVLDVPPAISDFPPAAGDALTNDAPSDPSIMTSDDPANTHEHITATIDVVFAVSSNHIHAHLHINEILHDLAELYHTHKTNKLTIGTANHLYFKFITQEYASKAIDEFTLAMFTYMKAKGYIPEQDAETEYNLEDM
jgi:hypothetical protein